MNYVIGFGIAAFFLYAFIAANPTFSFVVITGLVSYSIYRIILNSKWLAKVDYNSKVAAEHRQMEQDAHALKDEWETTDYKLPTPEEFIANIERQYLQRHEHLRRPFLQPILNHQRYLYERSPILRKQTSVAETHAQVSRLTRLCLEGLEDFTRLAPPAILTTLKKDSLTSVFVIERTFQDLVPDPDMLAPCYTALANTLRKENSRSLIDSAYGPIILIPDLLSESDWSAREMILDENLRPSQAEAKWRKLKKTY